MPPPLVLGHEPAGIVEQVGADVSLREAGRPRDRAASPSSAAPASSAPAAARTSAAAPALDRAPGETPRLSLDGKPLYQMAQMGSFAEQMLVPENALVKIRDDMPLDRAALIGCGVTTGVGAALNTARVRAGLDLRGDRLRRRRPQHHPGLPHRRRGRIVAVDTQDVEARARAPGRRDRRA